MDPLVWAGLLLLVGLALIMTEVFVPSGGVLGVLALSSIVVAIVLAFWQSGVTAGFMFVLVSLIAVPTILFFAFQWLPETPIGRRLIPEAPSATERVAFEPPISVRTQPGQTELTANFGRAAASW